MFGKLEHNFPKKLGVLAVAFLCLALVVTLQQSQLTNLKRKENISTENLQQEVTAEALRLGLLRKLPSFGFDNLIADWAFLGFIQYFGDELGRSRTGYNLSPE